jgi:cytochrome b561
MCLDGNHSERLIVLLFLRFSMIDITVIGWLYLVSDEPETDIWTLFTQVFAWFTFFDHFTIACIFWINLFYLFPGKIQAAALIHSLLYFSIVCIFLIGSFYCFDQWHWGRSMNSFSFELFILGDIRCPTSGVAQRTMREAAPYARGVNKAR